MATGEAVRSETAVGVKSSSRAGAAAAEAETVTVKLVGPIRAAIHTAGLSISCILGPRWNIVATT